VGTTDKRVPAEGPVDWSTAASKDKGPGAVNLLFERAMLIVWA